MPVFSYVAKDQAGTAVRGRMEAAERRAVIEALHKQELVILEVGLAKGQAATSGRAGRTKLNDLVIFSRQLATLIDAGVPLLEGLSILADQTERKGLRMVLGQVRGSIEGGSSFSEALAKHPRVFGPLYLSMIRAGEVGGRLDEILDRLATYLEKMQSLQRKVRSALIYPIMVILVAIGITTFLMVRVIPTFKEVFATLEVELPVPTLFVIAVSDFIRMSFVGIILGVAGLGVLLRQYTRTPQGRLSWDRFQLRWPLLGSMFQKVAIARFSRTLSTLVKSGVPILLALEIVGKTAGNKVIEEAIGSVRVAVKEGERIALQLEASSVFPPMVTRMIAIGEESGSLEAMLTKIADFYDEQVDILVTTLTSLLEPAIIVILGGVIGGIVVSMFLPIFKLVGAVTGGGG